MDTEKSDKVVDVVETPPQEQTAMEKEAVSKLESPEVSTEPEKPQAVDEEPKQQALNGHDKEAVTENKTNMETEDSSPKEKSETESVSGSVAPPEPDESSKKISHPVSDTEPKNILPEQQPASKNDPEPLPMKTHLADSASEPKPEKRAESVPQAEIQEQTLPKPTTAQQSVDTQPPSQVSGPAQSQAELQATMESGAEQDAKKAETKNNVADESPKEGGEERPVDTKKVAAASSEKAPESEQNDAESKQEEDTVPASGSLSFPLLEKKQTIDALGTSRILVVLRGLPGSGKSFLARAIADAYKDNCTVISADDHGVKPEDPESSVEGYKALDEAIVTCCSPGTASLMMVVDDTNHTQNRLAHLEGIAKEHSLVAVFLEPQTEWRGDPAQLTKKTRRGLDEAQLEAMKGQFEEMSIPFYFGWFLLSSVQEKIRCTSMDFVKTLDTLEAFKKHMSDFSGKAEKEVDLEQYFEAKGPLHCTTKFCDYGKAEGAKEYALQPAVKDFYGSTTELSLSALFVTPRTVGARVSLTEEQLQLWPADAEKEAESVVPAAASLPLGSRAHITLGCAEGVEAVQTGLDLLEILALQKEGQQGELVEEMELGSLTYYGNGRWFLSLREPICASACFSSYYKRKKVEPTKKESEKKKKQKCTIL